MKQEFFRTVGDCRAHEYMCDESVSVEKIYNNVMEKVSLSQKRRRGKIALFGVVSGLVTAVAIFCMVLLPGKDGTGDNRVTRFQEESNGRMEKRKDAAVVFCVYEAQQGEQVIMANYMDVMVKREVKTEKNIVLGTYDPLSSTVPGYPVMISNSKKKEAGVNFSITTSEGQLLQWDQETGDVKELGKTGTFKGDKRIFWSPVNHGKIVGETEIRVDLLVEDQLEDTVNVKIVRGKGGGYTATRMK